MTAFYPRRLKSDSMVTLAYLQVTSCTRPDAGYALVHGPSGLNAQSGMGRNRVRGGQKLRIQSLRP
jgi:hypothetical protein